MNYNFFAYKFPIAYLKHNNIRRAPGDSIPVSLETFKDFSNKCIYVCVCTYNTIINIQPEPPTQPSTINQSMNIILIYSFHSLLLRVAIFWWPRALPCVLYLNELILSSTKVDAMIMMRPVCRRQRKRMCSNCLENLLTRRCGIVHMVKIFLSIDGI